MKLKELRCVLSVKIINLYLDFGVVMPCEREEYSEDNEYLNKNEESIWDVYGEYEIQKIYGEDSNTINIDLTEK